ncbi:hypothetical protein SCAR479_13640 [Seiridium cardinale]|uniref:Ankyrin repeat protein n=1 Tax=Seiridium cardinale TaxID=138064 RepID=A0ABR2X7U0_9PEZI
MSQLSDKKITSLDDLPSELIAMICAEINNAKDKVHTGLALPEIFVSERINIFQLELAGLKARCAELFFFPPIDDGTEDGDDDYILRMMYRGQILADLRSISILHAIRKGYVDVVRVILKSWEATNPGIIGGTIRRGDELPWLRPLVHYAIDRKRPDIVEMLLEEGADPNRRYIFCRSPHLEHRICSDDDHKDLSTSDGHCLDSMDFLLKALRPEYKKQMVADVGILDEMGLQLIDHGYVLSVGLQSKFVDASQFGALRLAKAIWSQIAGNTMDEDQRVSILTSALNGAVERVDRNEKVIDYLLGLTANSESYPDEFGSWLIEDAVRAGCLYNAIFLLQKGLKNRGPRIKYSEYSEITKRSEEKIEGMLALAPEDLLHLLQGYETMTQLLRDYSPE